LRLRYARQGRRRGIAPVAGIIRVPNVMEVHPSVPAKTVPDFIAYAKANPGKMNFGSSGIGTTLHISGELFKMMAGVNMVHVPYRGEAPALTDLLGGQVQVMFGTMPPAIEHIRAGTLRALAVTTSMRSEALPDIPTIGDFVPGFEASAWFGLGAPKNTPIAIIDKLNKEINAGLADPKIKARIADLGGTVLAGSPADFGKLIVANEIEIKFVIERRIDRARRTGHEDRIAVSGRTHDHLGADIVARAGPVLNDELLAKPLGQPLSYQARDYVGGADETEKWGKVVRAANIKPE
jgi:tripartite-type tricarboxylate transporter receptor subunit TctC